MLAIFLKTFKEPCDEALYFIAKPCELYKII
jgi:hypothetical protein